MRAIVLQGPGKPEMFRVSEHPVPEPGPGEIRVRIHAFPLNPVDYKVALNGHPAWTYPYVPGVDGAGIIDFVAPALFSDGASTWNGTVHGSVFY